MADRLVDEMVARYKQWSIGGAAADTPVVIKSNYNLHNKKTKKYLQYESQSWGINLGWTDDAHQVTADRVKQWRFERSGSAAGPILYGEEVAIYNTRDKKFVHYTHRDVGINLGWSEQPVYEWKLLGSEKGKPVLVGDPIAIYNEKDEECLIYFDRTVGGDIGWPSSKTWGAQVTDSAWSFGKKAAMTKLGL